MLELRNLRLKPGSAPIDHEFSPGTISVVLGRNFSGKTQLARVIAGLEPACAGDLLLDGEVIGSLSPGDRPISLVYQAFVNYPTWTVFKNIASPLLAQKRRAAEVQARVEDIADKLELTPLLDRLPHTLSGGQQQRVAIGRALAKGARVLVMDEPLVNLDYKLREALQLELRDLLHTSDLCVIYTTSDPRDAFALGDSVLLLADHALLQSGRPLEVYQQPASPAAADLMSDPGVNRLQTGSLVQVVRPEHLHLQQTDTDDVTFDVIVSGFETNGSETFLHCTVQGVDWVARLDGLRQFERGSHQRLHVSAASVHEFPATAERVETPDPGVLRHG